MDHISLKSNNFSSSLINSLDHFKDVDSFVDVTLVCEGHNVKAHKIILSAGSNLLRRLLLANPAKHPIIILTETKYDTLRIIIDFLYKGRIDVPRNDLKKLLQIAITFEMNELKKLCEENLNSKKVDNELNLHPCLKSPDLSGSSPKKKRQRRLSTDSDILINEIVPKKENTYSSCRFEQSEISVLTETLSEATQTEFDPQITDARSVSKSSIESSIESDLNGTYVQTPQQKDASTECGIQPLKELKCNFVPIKSSRVTVKPVYNEKSDDSESDTQNKSVQKNRKRSPIWQHFTAITSTYAACNICQGKLSYRTTVTNLTKHLLKKHRQFDPKNPPKLLEVPLLKAQREQLEAFEEIDFNFTEDETGIEDAEHLQYEVTDESIPSTSTPCILKIT
ncbi:protein abrupt-like [Argiope bruennichi]|uniref:Protein bric-a-brac 2 like protein n=1 Tax=Argiope bruennichi TaxID=94029 RepID=A0A8T0EI25_ARGBR|nr:protein abrupt-like [Argiope bruennichi]KAF8771555.1 Protein bric-a-brac 2 like protein [Argiope bruennichi]